MPPGYIKKFLLAMRITALLLFAAFMQVSAAGFAQRLTLHQKDATLKQVFDAIHQQTGYNFVWSADQLNTSRKVDADFKDTPILEALDKCLAGTGLTYTIEEKTVIIKKKEDSLLDKAKAFFAQVTLTGKITNETGEPLLGVTVRIKNSQQATTTDKNGVYTITVPDDKTIIAFSFVGYETIELPAKDIPNGSTIRLKASNTNLREVIVNQGYYLRKQEANTGNVAVVSGADIQKQPVTDPLLALEGRVAGLVITQTSGIPGAYSTVRLRGQNSINNGLDPLYIVDGVPYSNNSLTSSFIGGGSLIGVPNGGRPGQTLLNNGRGLSPFNNLNPSDIESIEVLKDADATAIYGSRGANGVILITTKKGKAGPMVVDANVSTGWGSVSHFLDLLNTPQYLQLRKEAFKNDNATPDPSLDYDLTYWDQNRYTDWQKVLIGGSARFTNAQASVSGGNATTQYHLSSGYSDQGTVFPGNYADKKASVHLNLNSNSPNNRFHLNTTVDYVNDNNNMPLNDLVNYILLAPNAPAIYDANGNLNWQTLNGAATWQNPLASANNPSKAVTDNLVSSMLLSYKLLPGLTIQSNFGYTHGQINQNQLTFMSSVAPQFTNQLTQRKNLYAVGAQSTWNVEPQLNFEKKIGKGDLSVLLGSTIQQSSSTNTSTYAIGFPTDALVADPQYATNLSLAGYNLAQYRYNALYGRIGYTYDQKYLLNITARRDGSSRFGPGRQFGNFGSLGAGWIFSREEFTKRSLPWLSFGKLRVSYGTTGNDQLADYQYLDTYQSSNNSAYQGVTLLAPSQLTNPYLAWERINKLEGAMELGFLKDRINIEVSYYRNRTDNQMVSYGLPISTGFTTIQYNLPAVIQNAGVEVNLNTVNLMKGNFKWTSNLNISVPRNKLVSFQDLATSPYASTYIIGQPLSIAYLYHSLGIDPQTGYNVFAKQNGTTSSTPVSADRSFVTPTLRVDYFGGIQNSFSYGNFQLDFLFQFVKQRGNTFIPVSPPGYFDYFGGAGNTLVSLFQNRWQKPGDNAASQRASQDYGTSFDGYDNLTNSDAKYTDASYIRLKNLSFSWQLPQHWSQKAGLQKARLYIQGQNLLTISNYVGLDPESQGNLTLPPLRMITVGLQVTL